MALEEREWDSRTQATYLTAAVSGFGLCRAGPTVGNDAKEEGNLS